MPEYAVPAVTGAAITNAPAWIESYAYIFDTPLTRTVAMSEFAVM
jgi:hypothetical protein